MSLSGCGQPNQSQRLETPVPVPTAIEHPEPPVTVTINSRPVYVEPDVSADWKVGAAIEIWNEALGCEYFYQVDNMTIRAVLVSEYATDDGDLGYQQGHLVMLNAFDYPEPYLDGPNLGTTLHEFGHILRLGHTPDPWDVMFGEKDTVVPYQELPTELTDNDLRELAAIEYDYC